MTKAIPKSKKRSFSGLTTEEAFTLIERKSLSDWAIEVVPRDPSPYLQENLRRLKSFAVASSEAGKELLINDLLREVVPDYPSLRVWKDASLDTETLTGSADYLIASYADYLTEPVLCAVEAKRDDFVAGETQCIAEMFACRKNNEAAGFFTDIYGIVSNGQSWVFYRWDCDGAIFERTDFFATKFLPDLLGAITTVCAGCAAQVAVINAVATQAA